MALGQTSRLNPNLTLKSLMRLSADTDLILILSILTVNAGEYKTMNEFFGRRETTHLNSNCLTLNLAATMYHAKMTQSP